MDWPLKTVSSLPFKDTFSEPLPVKDGCHCGIDPVMLKAETTVSHLKVAWFQLNLCNGAHTRVIESLFSLCYLFQSVLPFFSPFNMHICIHIFNY